MKYIQCEKCGKRILFGTKAYEIGDYIACKKCFKKAVELDFPKYVVDEYLADEHCLTIYSKIIKSK